MFRKKKDKQIQHDSLENDMIRSMIDSCSGHIYMIVALEQLNRGILQDNPFQDDIQRSLDRAKRYYHQIINRMNGYLPKDDIYHHDK